MSPDPQTTRPDESAGARPSAGVALAVAGAALALIVSVFALGRALASGPAAPLVGEPAATDAAGVDPVAPTVTADLTEFAIAPGSLDVAEGAVLAVANRGAAPHNLKVRGTDVGTADLDPGQSADLDLSGLAAGSYDVFCSIPGHEAAGMIGTLTVGGGDAASTHATAGEGQAMPTAEEMEAAMVASLTAFPAETEGKGGQVMEPTILPDGTKEFRLVVDEVRWEVEPGKVVDALAYNGQIPGPTIKVDLGDKVRLIVENRLEEEATTLHPHGLRDHGIEIDGVGYITQDPIRVGESFAYDFVAESPSVAMYHSHHMSLHQVPNGLAGAMIVGDYAELAGVGPVEQEITMMLNDAGNIGFSLNGKSFPATEPYSMRSGERMLVHYMNEGLMPHPMHLHGQEVLVVAKDGYVLDSPYYADTINVAPGERYTVLVEAGEPGTWVWHCHVLSHVKRADGSMFGMLTAVIVEE